MTTASKPRILYVSKILFEETDESTGLSLPQLQERLAEYGISCERKALYRDFEALAEIGMPVGRIPGRPVSYYWSSHPFEPSQMMLLVDAVQTSKSVTEKNSKALIKKLKGLTSKNEAKKLDSRVHVAGRVKMQNESIFQTLDLVSQAISEKRDISFSYLHYDTSKMLAEVEPADGEERVKTPLYIVYSNDNYYVLVWDKNSEEGIRVYRADRMYRVMVREKSPKSHKAPAGFNVAEYESQALGMFAGKARTIKLAVPGNLIGSIIDIFGTDGVDISPRNNSDGCVNVRVQAAPTPVLFGKIAQFGGEVRIESPKKVAKAYTAHLKAALKAQK